MLDSRTKESTQQKNERVLNEKEGNRNRRNRDDMFVVLCRSVRKKLYIDYMLARGRA